MKTKKKSRNKARADVLGRDWDLAQKLTTGESGISQWPWEGGKEKIPWSDCGLDFPYGGDDDELSLAAEKAVATAVIHNLIGLPATELWVAEKYVNCGKTDVLMPARANGLREVAGYSWGNRKRITDAGFTVKSTSPELENAEEVVRTYLDERNPLEDPWDWNSSSARNRKLLVNGVVSEWVLRVEKVLREHDDFIQRVARLLVSKGRMSAKQFDFWMRHARIWKEKREKRLGTGGFDPSNN